MASARLDKRFYNRIDIEQALNVYESIAKIQMEEKSGFFNLIADDKKILKELCNYSLGAAKERLSHDS
jgi:hypothetical protein